MAIGGRVHQYPTNHSGGIRVNQIISSNHVGTSGHALGGDRCGLACPYPFKVFSFERRQYTLNKDILK